MPTLTPRSRHSGPVTIRTGPVWPLERAYRRAGCMSPIAGLQALGLGRPAVSPLLRGDLRFFRLSLRRGHYDETA